MQLNKLISCMIWFSTPINAISERPHPLGDFWAQRRNARGPRLVAPKPRGSAMTISCHKNNLRSPNVLLRAVAVSANRLKLVAVGGTQLNVGSLVHSPNSHTRVRQRIPKRIEMSDLVH